MILKKFKQALYFMVFLLIFSSFSFYARAEIPKYEVPPSNIKIPNQKGYTGWKQIVDKGKLIYEGYLQKGVFHGEGVLYDNGAIVYSGNWSNGQYDGFGVAYYSNGNKRYEGDFITGLLTGYGKYYYENGNKSYDGNLKEGYREGFGTTYSIEGAEIESKEYLDWTIVFKGESGGTNGRWGLSTNFSVLFFTGMIGDSNVSAKYFDNNGQTVLQPSINIESNKNYNIFIEGTDFINENNNLLLDITRLKVQVADDAFVPVTKTATKIDSNGSGQYTRNLRFILDLKESTTEYNDSTYITNIKDTTDFSTTITISFVSL
jgi:antitoxin component YwqK of YwqJK toxin-antitoxin module